MLRDAEDTWRGTGFLGAMALFWNALTWVFIACAWSWFKRSVGGAAGLVPAILLMFPFIAAGVVLVYAWIRKVRLTRRMPAGELTLPHWPLCPGDVVEAAFRRKLRDATGSEELQLFDCALLLHEEVRYSVGTDTCTDEATAREIPIESVEGRIDREGIHARFTLAIPHEGPPSFQAPSNLLTWRLRFMMQAGGYSKDDSVFDLLVVPAGSGGRA